MKGPICWSKNCKVKMLIKEPFIRMVPGRLAGFGEEKKIRGQRSDSSQKGVRSSPWWEAICMETSGPLEGTY